MKKKYYVKREVLASSIVEAVRGRGKIYEVCEAPDNEQPSDEKKVEGFIKSKKKN